MTPEIEKALERALVTARYHGARDAEDFTTQIALVHAAKAEVEAADALRAAIRAALAPPNALRAEPVAWRIRLPGGPWLLRTTPLQGPTIDPAWEVEPLYTTPPSSGAAMRGQLEVIENG